MMKDKPNQISFDIEKYGGDKDQLWAAISSVLRILVAQEYVATVRYDDVGIYIVEFDYDDEMMGTPYPYWITPDEYETFLCSKCEDDDEETF